MRDSTLKRRDLDTSQTLGCVGRKNNKTSNGSSGHSGGTRSGQIGQTWKKPKNLSVWQSEREREERGRGEGGWTQKIYLCCHRNLDTSVSRTCPDSVNLGYDNRCTCVHVWVRRSLGLGQTLSVWVDNRCTCVHVWTRRGVTGNVRTQKKCRLLFSWSGPFYIMNR